MLIRYSDGSFSEGVLHKLDGGTLRTTVTGSDDVVEFKLIGNEWTSEAGRTVTFEFPFQIAVELSDLLPFVTGEIPVVTG